jgi:RNA polymerase sigma factor (sigma-70 family)
MFGEVDLPYEERRYRCPTCLTGRVGYAIVRKSPCHFFSQPHHLYPMRKREFDRWVKVLRANFPTDPYLGGLDVDWYPGQPRRRTAELTRIARLRQALDAPRRRWYSRYAARVRAVYRETYREASRAELRRFLGGLPEQERLILTLRYGYGLPDRDIGQVLNLPEQRITNLRTLTRLRAGILPPLSEPLLQFGIRAG